MIFDDLPKLEYRSIDFDIKKLFDINYFQQNSVINYPLNDTDYTRIIEYKHFLNQQSKHSIIVYETTNSNGEPYYPVPSKKNIDIFLKWKKWKNINFKLNIYTKNKKNNTYYYEESQIGVIQL